MASLTIKGGPEDNAVLCTSNKTYNIRSVTLSNSVLVVSPRPDVDDGGEDQVVIQDSLSELLELVPAVPKLYRMNVLLKGHEWEEGQEVEESFGAVGTWSGPITSMARLIWLFGRRSKKDLLSTRPGENSRQAIRNSRKHLKRSIYLS
jgi:hypothetical protein